MKKVIIGIAIGSVLGLLFAPEKGSKTRKKISRKGKRAFEKINDTVGKERLMELKSEFEDHLENINEKIKKFAHIS